MFLQGAGLMGGSRFAYLGEYYYLYKQVEKGDCPLLYGSFGATDMNLYESLILRACIRPWVMRKTEVFDGGHVGAPENVVAHAFDWFEAKIFLELPPRDEDADIAKQYYLRQCDRYQAAKTSFEKYELREAMHEVLKRYLLPQKAEVKKTLDEFLAEIKTLGEDPEAKKELGARTAFRKVAGQEEPAYEPQKSSQATDEGKRCLEAGTSAFKQITGSVPILLGARPNVKEISRLNKLFLSQGEAQRSWKVALASLPFGDAFGGDIDHFVRLSGDTHR